MKVLSDRALIRMFDTAHAAPVRTDDVETTESLTGELISNRALFDTFGRVTTYALEHALLLRCDFQLNGDAAPKPEWTVLLGSYIAHPYKDGYARFAKTASATSPVLHDAVREIAMSLGLLPSGPALACVH